MITTANCKVNDEKKKGGNQWNIIEAVLYTKVLIILWPQIIHNPSNLIQKSKEKIKWISNIQNQVKWQCLGEVETVNEKNLPLYHSSYILLLVPQIALTP